jgi:hypothetical protein
MRGMMVSSKEATEERDSGFGVTHMFRSGHLVAPLRFRPLSIRPLRTTQRRAMSSEASAPNSSESQAASTATPTPEPLIMQIVVRRDLLDVCQPAGRGSR